ncbi:MAG: hypothetical protein ABJE95_25780 [Byssovorax sp.]
MTEETGESEAEDAAPIERAEAVSALRIESPAIAWSSRERTRSRAFRWMGGSAVAAVVALGVGIPFDSGLAGGLFALSMVSASIAGLTGVFASSGRGASKSGVIERRGETLVIALGGVATRVALGEVTQGWIEDVAGEGEACDVVLHLESGRDVAVRVPGRNEGEALLRAARVSVVDRVLRVPIRSLASSQRFGEVMGLASMGLLLPFMFIGGGGLLWFVVMVLLHGSPLADPRPLAILVALLLALTAFSTVGVRFLARFLRRREVIVGTDGVALEGFGKRRFVSYSRVRRVARDPRGVRLYLNDGVSVLLPTLTDANAPLPVTAGVDAPFDPASAPRGLPRGVSIDALYRKDLARREALFERIEQAMQARGQSRVPQVQLAQLDRQRRTLPAWRKDLRALLAVEGSGYRGAALGSDQLAEVVEDAGAPAERRVAAAIALSSKGDPEARRRVRVAVEACADEDLRAALEHAAEGEIEEAELERVVKARREVK